MNKALIVVMVTVLVIIGGFFALTSSQAEKGLTTLESVATKEPSGTSATTSTTPSTSAKQAETAVRRRDPPPPAAPSYQIQPTIDEQQSLQQYPSAQANLDEPPLKLKGIGVNFEDFKFTKEGLQFGRLFMGFGFVIPASSSSSGNDKSNPQPTYVVPLGTPVRSIVDGIVAAIPTLWSGDVSIQVTADGKLQK